MARFLVTLLISIFSVSTLAVDNDNWEALVEYTIANGKRVETQVGTYVMLEEKTSETQAEPHQANYLSLVGRFDVYGNFGFNRAEAVWEKWTVTVEGNLQVDQWMFVLSTTGELTRARRYDFVKNKLNTVLKNEVVPITAEESFEKWESLRTDWYKKIQVAN